MHQHQQHQITDSNILTHIKRNERRITAVEEILADAADSRATQREDSSVAHGGEHGNAYPPLQVGPGVLVGGTDRNDDGRIFGSFSIRVFVLSFLIAFAFFCTCFVHLSVYSHLPSPTPNPSFSRLSKHCLFLFPYSPSLVISPFSSPPSLSRCFHSFTLY